MGKIKNRPANLPASIADPAAQYQYADNIARYAQAQAIGGNMYDPFAQLRSISNIQYTPSTTTQSSSYNVAQVLRQKQ